MGHTLVMWLESAGMVLGVGLLLGAGLPALFALGVRALAYGAGEGNIARRPHTWSRIAAWLIFSLVGLAVLSGILVVVASGLKMDISFRYIIPILVERG